MLEIELLDGTKREVDAREVQFDETGVTFTNSEMSVRECVTHDRIKSVLYKLDVTEAMRERSKKIQFRGSDARPRRNTMNQLG